jgi:hypothetical protein
VSAATTPDHLGDVRHRRARLLAGIRALDQAVTEVGRADWRAATSACTAQLAELFTEHVQATEGPDGVYSEVLRTAAWLSPRVESLQREHTLIAAHLSRLSVEVANSSSVDDVRRVAAELLARLRRHHQRGADLVYDAFDLDLGGED